MDSNVILALAGASLLILALKGDLGAAWTALLGGDPHSAKISPTGQTLCHFSASDTVICTQSDSQCVSFGGMPRPDTLGYCAPGGAGRLSSSPGPGAPGSGVTTQ